MRTLTEAEARVLLALLGAGDDRQTLLLRRSEVPRSTFTTIRHRALVEGWIYERAIPLALSGVSRAVFALARPFAESVERIGKRWEDEPGSVLLWQSPEFVFGVFLDTGETETARDLKSLRETPGAHEVTVWSVPVNSASLPVYFDYEGVWSRLVSRPSQSYPRSLGEPASNGARTSMSPGLQQILGELLRRPYRNAWEEGAEVRRFGSAGFPRSWRRLLSRGYAEWRIFPDLGKMPPPPGSEVVRLALIEGRLRRLSRPVMVFEDLVAKARVFPFLYAIEEERVLLGALGVREDAPVEDRSLGVLETLQSHLEEIKIVACDLRQLRVPLDHRYERVFSPLATNSGSGNSR